MDYDAFRMISAKPHFGEWLRWSISRWGFSKNQFAAEAGIDAKTVGNLIEKASPDGMLDKSRSGIAIVFGISEVEVFERYKSEKWVPPRRRKIHGLIPASDIKGRGMKGSLKSESSHDGIDAAGLEADEHLPTFSASVSAGGLEYTDVEHLLERKGVDRFRVPISGECMEPEYPHGSLVVFSRPAALGEGIVDGKDYLVWCEGERSTFKQLFRDKRDPAQYLVMRSRNPDKQRFPDRRLHRREIQYIAKVVGRYLPPP